MALLGTKKLGSKEDHSKEQEAVLKLVTERFHSAERLHRSLREKWAVWYSLSRNYRRLQRAHSEASGQRDRDVILHEAGRAWGEELFVPYVYTVIETNVPRICATDPDVIAKPNNGDPSTYAACAPVRRLFERDQKRMRYPIRLQETVRSGLRYGLGVQKSYWHRKTRSGRRVVPMESEAGYKVIDDKQIVVYEGPMVEPRDIFDFFWDPDGHDLDSCGYIVDRTWRGMDWIKQRVVEGRERRERDEDGGWVDLDLERVEGLGSDSGRGEVWAERMLASGLSDYDTRGNKQHEVWEYHDRENVYTILDRELVVQMAPNPFLHGDFPFQIYRPTLVEHEFCGVGEPEPISHLQYELNSMRGQRRDAATLALNRGYFYSKGMLNPKKVITGAGVFVPVQGDPREVVHPMPFNDIPASSVSEEEALKADIERTTGISDPVTGGGDSETATGTQLVQAAANQRIRQKLKNLHHDLLVPEVAQRRELYRANLTDPEDTQSIRVDVPISEQAPTGYVFIGVGPEQINADIDVEPVDGSTEADNEVQKRADAAQMVDALSPFMDQIDPDRLIRHVLEQFGVDKPEEFMAPPKPEPEQIIEAIGLTLQEAEMPEEMITQVLQTALARLEEPDPEGPSPEGSAPESEGGPA